MRSRWKGVDIPDDYEDPLAEMAQGAPPQHAGLSDANRAQGKFDGINAKARKVAGALNGPEKKRAEVLERRRIGGEIQGWEAQAWTCVLANGCTYRPDFKIIEADGSIVYEEIKGTAGWKLDKSGQVKFKVAAERYPYAHWRGVIQKEGGGWEIKEHESLACWPPIGSGPS
jgi:hypothetical protein